MCDEKLMLKTLEKMECKFTYHWIDDVDHGFKISKKSMKTQLEIDDEINQAVVDWCQKFSERFLECNIDNTVTNESLKRASSKNESRNNPKEKTVVKRRKNK